MNADSAAVRGGHTNDAFFTVNSTRRGEILTPLATAAGNWGPNRMRGLAVSGALARAAENALPDPHMRAVRWTLDLCRPATMDPCRAEATILRTGRRLNLIEAVLIQQDVMVAIGRALFLRPDSVTSTAPVWAPTHQLAPPPMTLVPATSEPRLYSSEGVGWTAGPMPHQNADRKQLWLSGFRIVDTELPSPFVFAASASDAASVAANWGEAGMEFINADLTLALARLPAVPEIGLAAMDRSEDAGIAISTVAVFDRSGVLGTVTVCAVANTGATVDPRTR